MHARVFTIIAILGILMGAGYILWLLQRVFYGPPQDKFNGVHDADKLERVYSADFHYPDFHHRFRPIHPDQYHQDRNFSNYTFDRRVIIFKIN